MRQELDETANPDAKRDDAITCWTYKKSLPGHNRYEGSDLAAIGRNSGYSQGALK